MASSKKYFQSSGETSGAIYLQKTVVPFRFDYVFLKNLFSFLNYQDLKVCSQVCKEWKIVSQIVCRNRINEPTVLLHHREPLENTRELVELSNGLNPSKLAIDLSRILNWKQLTSKESATMINTFFFDLEEYLWNTLISQFSEPALVVGFMAYPNEFYLFANRNVYNLNVTQHCDLVSNVVTVYDIIFIDTSSEGGDHQKRLDIFQRVRKIVPAICAVGTGVIMTHPHDFTCLENERLGRFDFKLVRNKHISPWNQVPMFSGVVIPCIPGLKIKTFNCGAGQSDRKAFEAELAEPFDEDNNITVKGIILLGNLAHRTRVFYLKTIHAYLKRHPAVAFGGGSFTKAFTHNAPKNCNACGLIIGGNSEVKIGSLALYEHENKTAHMAKQLELFKTYGICGSNDFALMFSCCERGYTLHNAEHVESSIFRSLYPNVPLVGAFTLGEYIHPYITNQSTVPQLSNEPRDLEFACTTVFVYVSTKALSE